MRPDNLTSATGRNLAFAILAADRARVIVLALSVGLLTACAATSTTKTSAPAAPTAQVEIQDAVGFTITEDVRVGGDVREDYESAVALLERGQHDLGIELLETVVEASPGIAAPHIDLGIAYHRDGDLDAAERHLLRALELSPEHPIVHNELGIVYRETGRFAEARESYEAALSLYPGYHFARRNLAVLCDLYLADLECALDNYEAYMATVVSDAEVSIWIADIRLRLGREE